MKILILPEFIEDLKDLDNIKTLARVMEKLFDSRFNFKDNRDDHRYTGVEDAWIRDISKGSTAYRSIFIKKNEVIYLYRTGTKKIEDNLATPDFTGTVFELNDFKVKVADRVEQFKNSGKLLKSPNPSEMYQEIMNFIHIPLKEMWIVSPLISKELFNDNNNLGKFINKAVESKTSVILITLPPKDQNEFAFYADLEIRNIMVLFHEKLHAKLWYFDIDFENASSYIIEQGCVNTAILGSANLTIEGLGQIPDSVNNTVELCYKLPPENAVEFYEYCNSLLQNSVDPLTYKTKLRWQ